MMAAMKFTCLVAAVLVTAWLTNANDSYEAVGVDGVSSARPQELAGNFDNGNGLTKNRIGGRRIGGKAKSVETNEGGYEKKQTMKVGRQQNLKGLMTEDDNDSGFVAFNADYHAPRHHPPKNN